MKCLREISEEQKQGIINKCPRCGGNMDSRELVFNSYSRHVPIYICSSCGTDEAMRDAFGDVLPLEEWKANKEN